MAGLTIGMPVYNGELFISEAIESLLSQTYSDFELIISDNASIDSTESICKVYEQADDRITYIRHSYNMGAAANFSFVARQGQATFFMWAAADDIWDPKWIETLLPIAKRYDCLAFGTIQQIDRNSNLLRHPANFRKYEFIGNQFCRRLDYMIKNPKDGKANPIYGIIPRKLLVSANLMPLCLPFENSDNLFLYNLLGFAEIRCDPSVYLYKRILSGEYVDIGGQAHQSEASTHQRNNSFSLLRLYSVITEIQKDARNRFLVFTGASNHALEVIVCYLLAYAYVLRRLFCLALRFLVSSCRNKIHQLPQ